MLSVFTHFAKSVLETGEGIFWSFSRSEIGQDQCYWTSKLMPPDKEERSQTDQGGLISDGFIITDWKGEAILEYQISNTKYQSGVLNEGSVKDFWESLPNLSLGLGSELSKYLIEPALAYEDKVRQIQKAQKDGEMWVMNLATELTGELENLGTEERLILALKSYYKLLKSGKAHCGGVIWTPELKCVSFSPEVFIHQTEPHTIKSFPIKGTGTKDYLEHSEKEISELLMVTDLLRNDLSVIAEKVQVPRDRFLTNEGHFYHAQCEIEGRLKNSHLTLDQLKKILPPGSMTGCPKHRVGQYIDKLEAFDRHFYSGTFGVKKGDHLTLGLLIRTLFFGDCHWYYPVGAGITVESDPARESQEVIEKAKVLLDFF